MTAESSKVRAFLYTFVTYLPILFIGIGGLYAGNFILRVLKPDLLTQILGMATMFFGGSLVLVALGEPALRLFYFTEALNLPAITPFDSDSNPGKQPVGIKISHSYNINEVANEILEKECDLLGKTYCFKVAKSAGLKIDDQGKIVSLGKEDFNKVEDLVTHFTQVFGRPALFTAETVLAKHPDLRFKGVFQ